MLHVIIIVIYAVFAVIIVIFASMIVIFTDIDKPVSYWIGGAKSCIALLSSSIAMIFPEYFNHIICASVCRS